MSEILTRLLLNTSDYDSKLGKAKRSSNDFASNIGGKATALVGKFAAGIGLVMGGVEAFNKVIQSSQTLGDNWNNTINACKGTVDVFFQSLATGNWDAFNGGLLSTISKMKEVSALRDTLSDAKLSMGFDTRKFEREYVRLEGIIDNETLSKEERQSAFTEMETLIEKFKSKVRSTGGGAAETLVKEMNAKFGKNFTLGDIDKFITEVNNEFLNTETLQRLNKYKAALGEMQSGLYTTMSGGVGGTYTVKNKTVEKQIEAFKAQNVELEKMRLLQQDNDESRQRMISDYEYVIELERRADEYKKRSLEKLNKITNLTKASSGASAANGSAMPVVGSLAAIDAEIKAAQQEYANTASIAAREAAFKTIQELQAKKGLIELQASIKAPEVGNGRSSFAAFTGLNKKVEWKVEKKDVQNSVDYAAGLHSIAGALGAINTMTGEGAAGFLSWAASVATASAQAIEAIRGVVAAKTAEAAASSGASAASTPVVGWLMVGGAIAAALAAFSKIPKFANGGVVGGSSYFGDKLIARVNSGETILTQKQASRALSMMDGGNVRVSGDVRLSGKDIYISLKNYMSTSGNKL